MKTKIKSIISFDEKNKKFKSLIKKIKYMKIPKNKNIKEIIRFF